MKRRTRLRKQGLPADPAPQPKEPARPSLYEVALALDAEIRRTTTWDPSRYTSDFNVLDDCLTYGVPQTVNCLSTTGLAPSALMRLA